MELNFLNSSIFYQPYNLLRRFIDKDPHCINVWPQLFP